MFQSTVRLKYVSKLFSEILFAPTLEADPDLITSLRYLSRDKRNPMNKLVTNLCRRIGFVKAEEDLDPAHIKTKLIFVATQLIYTMLLVLPSFVVYRNYYLSCFWLVAVFLKGTWNGASYYIEIFSTRYGILYSQFKVQIFI